MDDDEEKAPVIARSRQQAARTKSYAAVPSAPSQSKASHGASPREAFVKNDLRKRRNVLLWRQQQQAQKQHQREHQLAADKALKKEELLEATKDKVQESVAARYTQNWRRAVQGEVKRTVSVRVVPGAVESRRRAVRKRSQLDRRDMDSHARSNHLASEISSVHGFLRQQNVRDLTLSTNYTERELYRLFGRFKALAALSSTPEGIDKETFRRGVPMLSVEDNLFVDRVFEVLDEDGSGIIDWSEFVEAMSSLEKGSREKRTDFLFRVYDIDKDGGITRDELGQFFLSSLMVEVDDTIREVSDYFVEQVFSEIDLDKNGSMTVDEAIRYIRQHPEAKDIFGMFGRSMTSDAACDAGDFLSQRTRHKSKQ